jgi:outer membrane receptor protein involved in Fe transport
MQNLLLTKTKACLTLCFIAICGILSAQQTVLKGRITDAASNEPVIGAVIKTGAVGTTSDVAGTYQITLDNGKHSVQFIMSGFATEERNIDLTGGSYTLDIALKEKSEELGIVVISAGKFEQKISDVTVSMEVIKPQLLQEKNVVSIEEALQQTPGVAIVDDEPQIRSGSGYSFGAGSRVQVLVDDLPMLSGDAGKASWAFLPIENMSQMEVVKGASSVLYGSSALSGVINMRTAYPGDKPMTRVTMFQGVYSNPRNMESKYWSDTPMRSGVNVLHSQKFGQLDFVLGANYYGDDGFLGPMRDSTGKVTDKGYNPTTVNRYGATNRYRINSNLRYRSKRFVGLSFGVNTNWMSSNSLSTLIWGNSKTDLYGAYAGSATRTIQLLGTVDPYIQYFAKKGGKHSIRSRWQSLDNNNDNNQGNFSDTYYTEYQYQQKWDQRGIKNFTTTMGAVAIYTSARGQLYTGGNASGSNTAHNYAAYLQMDKKFWNKLNVSAGVRYEAFSINTEKQSKPVFRSGLSYQLLKATYLRASYGQGYRFPSIAEKFIVTSLGAVSVFANPALKPETSYNIEFGIKQGFKINKFYGFIDLAVFQQEFSNFIEFTFGQWNHLVVNPGEDLNTAFSRSLGFKSVNTGKAKVQGAEISVMGEGKIGAVKLQTLIGYTYTMPVSTTPDFVYGKWADTPDLMNYTTTSSDPRNNILKYRLQHLIRADVGATYRKFNLGLSFRYNSHMQNIDNAFETLEKSFTALFNPGIVAWRSSHTAGDFVFDTRVGWQIKEHHKIALVVSNLLNREYAIRPLAMEETRVTTIQYTFTL